MFGSPVSVSRKYLLFGEKHTFILAYRSWFVLMLESRCILGILGPSCIVLYSDKQEFPTTKLGNTCHSTLLHIALSGPCLPENFPQHAWQNLTLLTPLWDTTSVWTTPLPWRFILEQIFSPLSNPWYLFIHCLQKDLKYLPGRRDIKCRHRSIYLRTVYVPLSLWCWGT